MPRQPKWVGEDLWHLLNDGWVEFHKRYPDEKKGTYKGKKSFWKKKILNGEIEMPPAPEREPQPNEVTVEQIGENLVSEISGWWEVVTANPEDPLNPVVTRAYKHSTKVRPNPIHELEQFEPATPARITPSKRKPVQRDHKTLFIFSDPQIDYRRLDDGTLEPIHDERAMEVARLFCRDLQPDFIFNLGDTVDLSSLSRFKADSDHFQRTIGPSFQRIHDYYASLRADNPNAVMRELDSNHNTRLKDFVLKNMPQMYGVKQAGASEDDFPVMTYPYLANLGHVGVQWRGGYGADTFYYGEEYGTPPIAFRHGTENSQNGTTASKLMKNNLETHAVQGHDHTDQHCCRTNRAGQYLQYHIVPALCRTTGEVPSYHSSVDDRNRVVPYQENWQQGVLVIRDYQGEYEFESVQINNGKLKYHGKEYQSE